MEDSHSIFDFGEDSSATVRQNNSGTIAFGFPELSANSVFPSEFITSCAIY